MSTDPTSDTVRDLARRYVGLVQEFVGGNREIAHSLAGILGERDEQLTLLGTDARVREYLSRAMGEPADH